MNRRFFILLFGVLMLNLVFGLGVSPARTTIDFKPGLLREISFNVINEGEDIDLRVSAGGDLAEYISIDTSRVSILASEKSKELKYKLSLPNDLSPGLHTGEVLISEIAGKIKSDGSYVRATLAVATQIHVYVPYPGKHANAKIYIYTSDEEIKFVIPVVSAGKFDLTEVRANVDIYNKLNEKIDSFNLDPVFIPSGKKKELIYNWAGDVPIGEYFAKVILIYDEGSLNLEEKFIVGSRELELEEIRVDDFRLGDIAKLEMLIENKWSEDIGGVYIETKIKDLDGDIVSSFESAAQDISALAKEVFVSYWDTAGVDLGDYDVDVLVKYKDKESAKNLRFEVGENELVIIGLGYVVSAESFGERDFVIIVLVVIIVVMVLINLLWFLILRKKILSKR